MSSMLKTLTGIDDLPLAQAKIAKFILLILTFGIATVQFAGIPIIFFRPTQMVDPVSGDISYDSKYPNIFSIPMEFNLYGDREIYEVYILTFGYASKYLGFLILSLFPVKPEYIHKGIIYPIIAIGLSLSSLTIYCTPVSIGLSFFVWFGFFCLFFGQLYQYVFSQFEGIIGKYSVFIINSTWSIIMMLYIGFATIFGGWKESVIYLSGYSNLIFGVALLFIQDFISSREKKIKIDENEGQNNTDEELTCKLITEDNSPAKSELSAWETTKKLIQTIKSNSEVKWNIFLWALCWNACGVSYIGCVLALNKLEGNLFFNLFVSTLFEFIGNFLSIVLIKYFNIKKVILCNLTIIGISYMSLLFVGGTPGQNEEGSSALTVFFQLFPVLISKGTHETMWNLLIEFQKHILDIEFHQINFSFGNLFDLIVSSSLPYYQFQMIRLKFNQFIGYGVYSLFVASLARKFTINKQVTYEDSTKVDESKNDEQNQPEQMELQLINKNKERQLQD